eukprot:472441-Rhodomonas_salina.2
MSQPAPRAIHLRTSHSARRAARSATPEPHAAQLPHAPCSPRRWRVERADAQRLHARENRVEAQRAQGGVGGAAAAAAGGGGGGGARGLGRACAPYEHVPAPLRRPPRRRGHRRGLVCRSPPHLLPGLPPFCSLL